MLDNEATLYLRNLFRLFFLLNYIQTFKQNFSFGLSYLKSKFYLLMIKKIFNHVVKKGAVIGF